MTTSIRQRLILLTLAGVLSATTLGGIGLWGAGRIQQGADQTNVGLQALGNHMEADMMHDALRADVLGALYFAQVNPGTREEIEASVREHARNFRQKMKANEGLELDAKARSRIVETMPVLDRYIAGAEEIVHLAFSQHARANAELAEFIERFELLETELEAISTLIGADNGDRNQVSHDFFVAMRWMLSISAGLAIAGTIVVGYSIARQIGSGMRALTDVAREAAEGNLRSRADETQGNELGEIARAFNCVVEQLGKALSAVARSADALGVTAQNITEMGHSVVADAETTMGQSSQCSVSAQDVSSQAQAASSSVEQFSLAVKEIAETATRGADTAQKAVGVARETRELVSQLVTSSTSIEAILGTINAIAEQTNMLALNATIEAARAGEAGKGFAVVANEVKELAKETSSATSNIAETITRIRRDASNANGALEQIESIIDEMSEMQTTIAAAVEEQSATTSEIASSIGSAAAGSSQIAQGISVVTQSAKNAADSGRRAGSEASRLSEIASEFKQLVARFQYDA